MDIELKIKYFTYIHELSTTRDWWDSNKTFEQFGLHLLIVDIQVLTTIVFFFFLGTKPLVHIVQAKSKHQYSMFSFNMHEYFHCLSQTMFSYFPFLLFSSKRWNILFQGEHGSEQETCKVKTSVCEIQSYKILSVVVH